MSAIKMYNDSGKELGTQPIAKEIVKKDDSPKTFACAIRILRQNWRQGTVGSKTRGEVSFSGKKPFRQKGTGRARAGTLRSPLWRKGGVIFGPQMRTRTLSFNDKQGKLVLNNLFFAKLEKQAICCVDFDIKGDKPSARTAHKLLENLNFNNSKIVLFLSFDDVINFSSFRNLPNVTILPFDQPNAYDLSNGDNWVFLKKDSDLFNEMVLRWN